MVPNYSRFHYIKRSFGDGSHLTPLTNSFWYSVPPSHLTRRNIISPLASCTSSTVIPTKRNSHDLLPPQTQIGGPKHSDAQRGSTMFTRISHLSSRLYNRGLKHSSIGWTWSTMIHLFVPSMVEGDTILLPTTATIGAVSPAACRNSIPKVKYIICSHLVRKHSPPL